MPNILNLPKSHGLRIENKAKDTAELIIYGAIGSSMFEDGISAKQFSDTLKQIPDSVKNLIVRINSPGGDVFEGYAIATRLKQHKASVTVYVDGIAASIASVIALAGNRLVMGEYAQLMIHNSWTYAFGNALDLERVIERLNDIDHQLVSIYTKKTKMGRDEVKAMMNAETWISAADAVSLGFAEEVIAETMPIAASVIDKATWLHKVPKNILLETDVIKKEVTNLQSKIEGFLARK